MSLIEGRNLEGIAFLSGLADASLRALEQKCRWYRYVANEQILDRDSENRDVFFVVKGEVRVVNYSRSGREIAYARVGPGGYFGELAAIDGQSRSASIVAAEECLVAALPPDVFVGLLADSPDLTVRVLKRLSGIIRSCDDRIMDLSTLRAVQRVYIELLRLAELDAATQSHWVIYPMRTQNMIATCEPKT